MLREERETLLVFSDVHLGSDLNDSGPVVARSPTIDRDLARLIAHYRDAARSAGRWRIVIAGDFIDLAGMSVDPQEGDLVHTELTDEERENGVGGAEDHGRLKLRRVAERHADVFAELGAFVADGHAVTVLHGNHDLELHWDSLKDDLRDLVAAAAPEAERAAARARVEFAPWFFYRKDVVYIEHGHQYDPFCATPFVLSPLSPSDPRRVERGFSATLLRAVVRRTEGMNEHGHEDRGLGSYFGWGVSLGARGALALGARFAKAIAELAKNQRAYGSERARAMAREHERRVAEHARAARVKVDALRALLRLQARPIATTLHGVFASVMLDRLAVGLLVVLALGVVLVLSQVGVLGGWGFVAAGALLAAWIALHVLLSRSRGDVDPARQMFERVARITEIFPAPLVVMGHTHVPVAVRVGGTTYINVGSWAEEHPDPRGDLRFNPNPIAYRAARTHLVIRETDDGPDARFYEWDPESGPRLRG